VHRRRAASLDSFRGYRNAIRDELPNAAAVPDAFHVVELDTVVVDEVRRRIQQDTLARRGHKDDPLYKIRGLLRRGHEQLTNRRPESLNPCLVAGDPTGHVSVAWHCYQQVRSMYQDEPASKAAPLLRRSSPPSSTVPSPEIAQLGRTLRTWKDHVLAPFDTHRISNGGTEAVNLIIEKVRRLAHGFRRKAPIPTRAQTMHRSEEPVKGAKAGRLRFSALASARLLGPAALPDMPRQRAGRNATNHVSRGRNAHLSPEFGAYMNRAYSQAQFHHQIHPIIEKPQGAQTPWMASSRPCSTALTKAA
jgi:hypothetical protein